VANGSLLSTDFKHISNDEYKWMIFSDQDIDFLKLTDRQFEELCFDLLLKLGYEGLVWRQGGADSGRDIEGKLTITSSLVGLYEEKWFFECKRYEKGISPEIINSKIAWADAEKPKHFVVFVSSYLSNNTREWLNKISHDKHYIIHPIEGKHLKDILLKFPDLISKYFGNRFSKLLIDAQRNWLIHDLLPDLNTISLLLKNIDDGKLSIDDLAFLWCSANIRTNEIDEWPDGCEPFNLNFLFNNLVRYSNTSDLLISSEDDISLNNFAVGSTIWNITYPNYIVARIVLNRYSESRKALYSFIGDNEEKGLEVLIEAAGNFPTKVRHVPKNARDEIKKSIDIFIRTYELNGLKEIH